LDDFFVFLMMHVAGQQGFISVGKLFGACLAFFRPMLVVNRLSKIQAATIFIPVILRLEMPGLSVHGRIAFRNEMGWS